MTKLDKLIADEFQKLQVNRKKDVSIFKQMREATLARLQEENAELKKEIAYLEPYQRLLTEPLYGWLLYGRVTIDELPLEARMGNLGYYIHAWRYAEAKHDVTYGMAILDLLQSDIIEWVRLGKLDQNAYGEYLKQWMQYLARSLSAFKESKDYDHYFLKLQEAHKALFDEYIGDIEDNRDWVSLL